MPPFVGAQGIHVSRKTLFFLEGFLPKYHGKPVLHTAATVGARQDGMVTLYFALCLLPTRIDRVSGSALGGVSEM